MTPPKSTCCTFLIKARGWHSTTWWPAAWTWPWADASARGRLRRWAGWGLLALLVAIFPANLQVAMQGKMPGFDLSPAVLWSRLPFQAVLMAWVWWVALAGGRDERRRA